MGHHKIRNEKNCLNCGTHVEDRFCPHCGQENIETRHPFHYLIGHFVEDLTHYDSSFWKTIKYLLFNPGKLTKEYLAGKRMSYVPPVKLYIFISFITFFLMAILPKNEEHNAADKLKQESKKIQDSIKTDINHELNAQGIDTVKNNTKKGIDKATDALDAAAEDNGPLIPLENYNNITSVEKLDFVHAALPKEKKAPWYTYYYARKYWILKDEGFTNKQIMDKWVELVIHNIPKAIFFYLPFFAFWLWLFHNKKKWYYFDHGIFSLHYFAFLLTITTIIFFISWIRSFFLPNVSFLKTFDILLILFCTGYSFFYFFRSHSRVYKESKAISRLKGITLFIINFIFIFIFLVCFLMVATIGLH